MNLKCFSTFITAIIYTFTIVLYTKIDLVKQHNFSNIALNTIAEAGNKTSNLLFKKQAIADF